MVQKSAIIEKKEHYMKKGFTLSELLLSLIIVGVVAVLTIPVLMNNVQHKTFATQVKNMSAMIEQMAQDELIAKHTKNLADTDFGDPEKLMSDDHFSISKSCAADSANNDCWKTSATGKDKVVYKCINRTAVPAFDARKTIILKNGVMLSYRLYPGQDAGIFVIDINGNDKPNIIGRDLFGFMVNSKGKVVDIDQFRGNTTSYNVADSCKTCAINSEHICYRALVDNGWKMDY